MAETRHRTRNLIAAEIFKKKSAHALPGFHEPSVLCDLIGNIRYLITTSTDSEELSRSHLSSSRLADAALLPNP